MAKDDDLPDLYWIAWKIRAEKAEAEIERLRDAGLEAQANEARAVEAAEQLRAALEEIKQASEPGRGAYILASRALLLSKGGERGGEAPQTMNIPHDASKAYGPL